MTDTPMTMREVHSMYAQMLKHFHQHCVLHGLRYYLVGGTLLGAVREKGFIPWDDDVDIAMPRPDYEKLLREYTAPERLESFKKNNRFFFPYAKLIQRTPSVVHIVDQTYEMDNRVVMQFDIYPIDGVGNAPIPVAKTMRRVAFYKRLMYLNQSRGLSTNIGKRMAVGCIRLMPSIWLLRAVDKSMSRHNFDSSGLVTRWRMPDMMKNVVPKEVFGTPVLLPFEDTQLYVPEKYDIYLSSVYGNSYLTPKRENANLRHDAENDGNTQRLIAYLENSK